MSGTDWHEWRSRGIGASDIAGIIGNSPWQSSYSVWCQKIGATGNAGTSGNAEAMRWGTLLEDAIIAETERRLEITIHGRQQRAEYPDWPVARCTLDGLYYSEADPEDHGVIEAKTTSDPHWTRVPEYYEAQIQWQLLITGQPRAWLPCLHNGRRLSLWQVEAEPETGAAMLKIAQAFWDRYVLAGLSPDVDGSTATTEALSRRYGTPDPEAVVDITPLAGVFDDLLATRAEIKRLERAGNKLENELKDVIGDRGEVATIDDRPAITWRRQVSKYVDLDILREKYPREAEECTGERVTRRFLVKAPK